MKYVLITLMLFSFQSRAGAELDTTQAQRLADAYAAGRLPSSTDLNSSIWHAQSLGGHSAFEFVYSSSNANENCVFIVGIDRLTGEVLASFRPVGSEKIQRTSTQALCLPTGAGESDYGGGV